jgi:hypothetical protein
MVGVEDSSAGGLRHIRLSRARVVPAKSKSRIPPGKDVIVVDIGDSALAPHQRKSDKVYFYRVAGHSVPVPHFYLELLRQRLVDAALALSLVSTR